jgi:predicted PurR-regulated permease PerM
MKVLSATFVNFTVSFIQEIINIIDDVIDNGPDIKHITESDEMQRGFKEMKDEFDFGAPVLSSYTQMINQIIASADSDIAGNRDYLIIKLEVDNIRKAIEDNITRIKGKVPAFTQKAFEDNIQAAKDAEKIGTSTEVTTAIDKANNSLASFKANITFVTDNITKLSVPDIYQYSGAKDIQTLRDYITKLREIQITNTEQVGNIEQKIDIITKAKKASDDAVIEAQGAAAAAKKKKLILFGGIGGGVLLLLIILFVLMRSKEE